MYRRQSRDRFIIRDTCRVRNNNEDIKHVTNISMEYKYVHNNDEYSTFMYTPVQIEECFFLICLLLIEKGSLRWLVTIYRYVQITSFFNKYLSFTFFLDLQHVPICYLTVTHCRVYDGSSKIYMYPDSHAI